MRELYCYRFRILLGAGVIAFASVCMSGDPRMIPDSASPDGKWVCRRTEIDESAAENGVDSTLGIVRAGTKKVAVELPISLGSNDADVNIIWAPDSKRFAYNFRAGGRYNTTQVYQLRDGKWVELESLESEETSEPLNRVQSAELTKLGLPEDTHRRRIWDSWEVRKWNDARTAVLYTYSAETVMVKEKGEDELADLSAHFLFTIKFDERGNWKITKTHQMSEEEVEEQNKGRKG